MGLKLEFPPEVERAFRTNRAQSSGLSPALRYILDSQTVKREFTDNCAKEAEGKRNLAVKDDAGRPRDDMEAQSGRVLTGVQVEQKLRRLNPSLIFEDCIAYPERRLIYRKDTTLESGRRLVAAMEKGPMPEFSVIDIPEQKWVEPTETRRGWRTVLGRCILARVITMNQAIRAFGIPTHESVLWKQTLC